MTVTIDQGAAPPEMSRSARRKVTDLVTGAEFKALTTRSDLMGFWAVGSTWAIIAAAFTLLEWASTQPLAIAIPSFVLGLCVLAGRQLCLGILMHDASHGSLFATKRLNQTFADWACARPLWNDLAKYRVHHLAHHAKAGTADDTDLSLVEPFPCSRASLARKVLRDVVGVTGLKSLLGRLLMDAGYLKWTVANDVVWLPKNNLTPWQRLTMLARNGTPTLLTNAALLGVLWAVGHPWLYAAWVVAYIGPFMVFVRIRSMAEHACTEKSTDIFQNTRSTRAGWVARSTVAPLRVNYHIEHHALPSVPYFRLPALHRMLRDRGVVPAPPSYYEVIEIVSSARSR